jgi:16S rRNA G966 N2-methylase RsmD
MEPLLPNEEKNTFYKYLDKSINYLEYGSGGSTIQALSRKNIKNIVSVESDKEWHNMILEIYKNNNNLNKNNNFIYFYVELNALPNTYGYPINASYNNMKQYANTIENIKDIKFDLIFIDGRFRVACALYCLKHIDNNCIVIVDDIVGRDYYNIIYDYYTVIETIGRMVVLKKKNILPDNSILQQYTNDPR